MMREQDSPYSATNGEKIPPTPLFQRGENIPLFSKEGMPNLPPFEKGDTPNLPPFEKGNTSNIPPFEKGGVGGILLPTVISLIIILLLLSSCSSVIFLPGRSRAPYYAREAGWSFGMTDAGHFILATALGPTLAGDKPLTIYIEGDGYAFINDSIPSNDPTPHDPTALRLALAHPGPAAYIARPCQFVDDPSTSRNCYFAYWSNRRYATEVIDSVGQAVDDLKQRSGARRVILAGYSGGGAVAALLASRRTDVIGLVTVAANLDIGYWTHQDGLAPLTGSLDPADDAPRLKDLPQVHFVGSLDRIVAPAIVRSFLSHLGSSSVARLIELPDADHVCCWVEAWPSLARSPDLCIIDGWGPC